MISSVPQIRISADIPHLESEGANWATFAFRFRRAMILAGRWDFFDSSNTRPIPVDSDNITEAEKQDGKRWDREDVIAQCLLGERLPIETAMDMDAFPTAEVQWNAVNMLFTAKSVYTKADLHQAFLDMRCPKGGNVREYLTSLKMKCYELKAAEVSVTDTKYQRMILKGVPDALADYAAQTLSMLWLAVKYTGMPVDMSDVIDSVCKEADRKKTRRTLNDPAQGQSMGRNRSVSQALDEALATASTDEGSNGRCRKGNCHHCGKLGHWARKCHTRKREEAAAAAGQSGQAAEANLGTTSKPENTPTGSTNIATIDEPDSDDMGFWAIEEEEAHACYAEADPWMDDSDSDDDDSDFCAKHEGINEHLNWPDIEGEGWYIKDTAHSHPNPTEPPMGDVKHDSDDKWEAFCTETWGAEDVAPHALVITSTSEPHRAPGKEGYMPHIGDGRVRTTSSYGEQVTDTMRHAHRPHDIVRSPELTHRNDPKPAIRACEGQSPSFDAIMQAQRAPWLRPGTTTKEQDVQSASAALLKGEEKRLPAAVSEQAAAPGTPSNFNSPKSPASPYEAISPEGLDSSPAQSCRTVRTHIHLCNAHDIRLGEAVHLGTNAPRPAPCLQASEAFAEDPDKAGGVTTTEDGALAPLQDFKTTESAFVAKTADAEALQPHTLAEAKRSTDKPLPALIPSVTDPAPASAAECAITHDVPYRGAVNTSDWAALATRPDTTFSDTNGSKAVDWCATSGRASLINDGAICWPSRRQEDVSPTTPNNDHVAATHGSKEASRPPSSASDTFSGPKALTTSFSDDHPPRAFTRDHQYHPPDRAYRHATRLQPSGLHGLQNADDTVANAPINPPASIKGRHFVASFGLPAK